MEMTAAGWLDWRRDISGEADFFHASVWVELGHGREQRLRVGMTGMIEHLLGRATFDDTAEIHHGDLIRQVLDNAQIVGDEKIRQPQVGLELSQEVEDLSLYRDVQRAGGLVADEEVRLDGEASCNTNTLPLATREFVGIAVYHCGIESHLGENRFDTLLAFLTARTNAVRGHALHHDLADHHARVQR